MTLDEFAVYLGFSDTRTAQRRRDNGILRKHYATYCAAYREQSLVKLLRLTWERQYHPAVLRACADRDAGLPMAVVEELEIAHEVNDR